MLPRCGGVIEIIYAPLKACTKYEFVCFCFFGGVIQCVGGVIKTGVFEKSRKAVKDKRT